MKLYITEDQYNELSEAQKNAAEFNYSLQKITNVPELHTFWKIPRMIDYLNERAFAEVYDTCEKTDSLPTWVEPYGFIIGITPMEEWCDKLWEKVKIRLQEQCATIKEIE